MPLEYYNNAPVIPGYVQDNPFVQLVAGVHLIIHKERDRNAVACGLLLGVSDVYRGVIPGRKWRDEFSPNGTHAIYVPIKGYVRRPPMSQFHSKPHPFFTR